MRGFSKVVLAGNLTRDPEMRSTPSGSQVCSFSIAVNRRYKTSNGDWQDAVSYIDCSAWDRRAETICQYLHKGSPILVSGRLDQHSWDDKTTGQKRSRVEVVVDDFCFLGGDRSTAAGTPAGSTDAPAATNAPATNTPAANAPAAGNAPAGEPEIDISDIPF